MIRHQKRILSGMSLLIGALILGTILKPGRVLAHAELQTALPQPGAVLTQSPSEIRLTFSEEIDQGSDIFLFTEGFQYIEGIEPRIDPTNPNQLYTPLQMLESNDYTVQWTAISLDGHTVSGTYTFRVENTTSRPIWGWLIGGVLLAGGGLLLALRQRKK